MKIFYSEFINNYSTYTFSYVPYCLKEAEYETPSIYDRGFLPFTAKINFDGDIFYLARSVRVNLNNFFDTSENRRVNKIISGLDNIEVTVNKKQDFDTEDPRFIDFCLKFAEERFSGGNMKEERFNYLLGRNNLNHILTYHSQEKIYAYILTNISDGMLHYWFAFYDTDHINYSLGKWIMWKTIHFAKENSLKYVYLGTCYTPKGLYKVRDHKGVEFFDGINWNPDIKLLKKLCENDLSPNSSVDLFKISEELSVKP